MDLNKVIMIGRLGKDPEIRTLPNGNLVCNLSIVTETSWKKDGERQTKAEWHKIVTFDQAMITYCQEFINVGDTLYIEGRLTYRSIEAEESTAGKKLKLAEIQVGKFGGVISIFRKKRVDENRSEANEGDSFKTMDDDMAPKKKKAKNLEEDPIPYDI